jgi:two-component system response regulator PilR (NtrC family)
LQKHILVVDDEPTLLMTHRLILEIQGYRSSEAATVSEAKHVLDTRDVDLLLCDLTLGIGETGMDVIEYARSLDPDIPAALLTGHNDVEIEDWARSHGVVLLQKPVPIPRLLQTIASLLQFGSQHRKTA